MLIAAPMRPNQYLQTARLTNVIISKNSRRFSLHFPLIINSPSEL